MFTTITRTIRYNMLATGVSLLLVGAVIVPGAMLAQQVTGVDETVNARASEKVIEPAPTEPAPTPTPDPVEPTPIDPPVSVEPVSNPNPSPVLVEETCAPNPTGDLRGRDGTPFNPFIETQVVYNGTSASVWVKNFSATCSYKINLAAYEVFFAYPDPDFISSQRLYNAHSVTLAPQGQVQLTVSLPSCAYQVDLFEGSFVPQTNPNFDGITYPTLSILDWIMDFENVPLCGPVDTRPTLTIVKTVINDNGGTKQVADFKLYAGTIPFVSGVPQHVQPGVQTVHEDQLPGYTAGVWGGDCSANGTVTLAAGDHKTCTITNNDNPVVIPNPAFLKVVKTVINDNGGTKLPTDFPLYVNKQLVQHNVVTQFQAGTYTVSEHNLPGYTAGVWGGDCSAKGEVTLVAGQSKTCTITNDDNPVIVGQEAYLTVVKTVINNNGGTKQVSDFKLFVSRVGSEAPTVSVISGQKNQFAPALYSVSEENLSGYTAGAWGGDCSVKGEVTLVAGQSKTCTITNDDNAGTTGDDDDDGGGGGGGGGGHRHPNVVLFSTPEILGSSISLMQVPYTGLGTSLFQIFLFILGLLAISGGVTYVIARRRMGEDTMETTSFVRTQYVPKETAPIIEDIAPELDALSAYDEYTSRTEITPAYAQYESTVDAGIDPDVPVDLPIAPATPVADVVAQSTAVRMITQRDQSISQKALVLVRLQDMARASRTLVSDDGMQLIANSAEGDEKKATERLNHIIEIAKARYPREDGWLVLDKGRVRESLFVSTLSMVPLFVEWMVRGEDKNIFGFLRMLKSQEQPVADFVRKVVAELDNAHRARLEGAEEKTAVHPHIAEVTYHLSNNDLETIIGELLQGVDERYDSAYTSVRLALVRVLDVIKERQVTRIGGAYSFAQNQEV
ncbi:hypothetical protein IPJ70_04105 [Candidatus Campbellbacteria bacterium]|nr:MAG: hypothetical protein IPJ70_04105 [Candidatus Campbellbacteria bacterium]